MRIFITCKEAGESPARIVAALGEMRATAATISGDAELP